MRAQSATNTVAPTTNAICREASDTWSCRGFRSSIADFAIVISNCGINLSRFRVLIIVSGVSLLEMPAQMNEQSNRHAHDDQRTDAQDQEPPDHPHSRLG